MRALLCLVALIAGCGPQWTSARPIQPWIPDLRFPQRLAILEHAGSALRTMGLRVDSFAPQRINFAVEAACPGHRGATADPYGDTIRLCPDTVRYGGNRLEWNVWHELGHVLGMGGHASCRAGNVMAPDFECWKRGPYSPEDIKGICAGGHLTSPVCST